MIRGKAYRRHQSNKKKIWAKNRLKHIWWRDVNEAGKFDDDVDEKRIGMDAETPVMCSGPCCGNPRTHFGELSMQEKRNELLEEDERDIKES